MCVKIIHSLPPVRRRSWVSCGRPSLFRATKPVESLVTKYESHPADASLTLEICRPFPFPCPPSYLHVTRVADERGGALAKRSLQPEHSLTFIRENSVFFPETLIGWCFLSFGHKTLKKCGVDSIESLIIDLSRSGAEWLLPKLAQRLTFHDLVAIPQRETVRIHSLRRLDRLLVRHLIPARLNEFACSILEQRGIRLPDCLDEFLIRLYEYRGEFAGAGELSAITLAFAQHHQQSAPRCAQDVAIVEHLVRLAVEPDALNSLPPTALEIARFHVMASTSGPPISVIKKVLGHRVFSNRLRQGIDHG